MANEISVTLSLQMSKGGVTETLNAGTKQFNMAGTNVTRLTMSATTTPVALELGGITTPGFILIHNLDATNYVEVMPDGTNPATIKLRAAGWACFEFAGAASAPNVKANTASCKVEYLLIEA